jgi:protein-S-isoprenylcysteine O-methyltransferase Ste14
MNTLGTPLSMVPPQKSPARSARRGKLILMASVGMLAINGLILTLWGWADWRGFFAHPARCALVALMIVRFAQAIVTLDPEIVRRGRDDKRVNERGFFPLLYVSLIGVMASPFFDARNLWVWPGGDLTRYAGLILFVAGFILSAWAQAHLGRFFSGHVTLQEGHHLITDGPFLHIRHPRYAGLMLLFLGLALLFRSTTGTVAAVAGVSLFLARIPREEALMAREFGEAWAEFARRTKRLLPGIY